MLNPKNYALRLIQMRSRSTWEINEKLKAKKFSEEEIQKTLAWLVELGFLDDQKFAKSFVEGRLRFRPRGKVVLKMELRKKGVSDEIITQTLTDIEPEDEQAAIIELIRIKSKRLQNVEPQVRKNRLIALLSRRGYRWQEFKDLI